ncbi:MAG: glycosyltransferase family 39 protein, partial [Anaerolineales bacterium]|nr:glycosyltransferase family 39 protein [Anaerolineales bacterium]
MRRVSWFTALCLIILAAFVLRVFRLDFQSLWYDEAFSAYLAHFDLATLTARTAADIQPPLYYYLLHFWIALAGNPSSSSGEFALRFLSLIFGVLTIPLLYVTARRLFNATTALIAALLATISPLYIWYSQEARMYTLITFLLLLSSYALLRALDEPRRDPRWWIVFACANSAAVYTHYFAFAVIAFQFLYALVMVFKVQGSKFNLEPRTLKLLTSSFIAIFVAFLPWTPFVIARFGQDASYWRGALKLDEALRHILINFSVGESVLENIAQPIA